LCDALADAARAADDQRDLVFEPPGHASPPLMPVFGGWFA
jgi:hypothetical protein